jgi:uncharacterized protein
VELDLAPILWTVTTDRDPVMREMVRRLVAAYHPERVYLFGSTARADASASSDLDVLVVEPDDVSPDRLRSRLAYKALWGLGVAADVVVMRRSEFETRAGVPTSLPATVLAEGVLLHPRPATEG